MSALLASFQLEKKKYVMQLGLQIIVSAEGCSLFSIENASIYIILIECMFSSGNRRADKMFANTMWKESSISNPFESFNIKSTYIYSTVEKKSLSKDTKNCQ